MDDHHLSHGERHRTRLTGFPSVFFCLTTDGTSEYTTASTMTITTEVRQTRIKQFQAHDGDTGSPSVQVALLTDRINGLADHFKTHKHDRHSRQGLLQMVSRRRRLLEYLKRHDEASYRKLLDALNLRK